MVKLSEGVCWLTVGDSSGKPNRTIAKHIPGPSASATANVEQLGARASTAAGEISRAHMLAVERGDKLSHLEDRTERMHMQAGEFSSSAHQLMLKYKDKKWYQLWTPRLHRHRSDLSLLYGYMQSLCSVHSLSLSNTVY